MSYLIIMSIVSDLHQPVYHVPPHHNHTTTSLHLTTISPLGGWHAVTRLIKSSLAPGSHQTRVTN